MATAKIVCGVCGAKRARIACHVITLTPEEIQTITANSGTAPQAQMFYCKPCWRTLQDPNSGPSLMKGIYQIGLRALGVSNADTLAKRYHQGLVSKIPKNPNN